MKHLKLSKASEKSNMYSNRSGNYMMIDADWIESSIQNYIELKRKINKEGNNFIMTQDYNAKIKITNF